MWQPSWACPTEGCFYPPTLFTDVQPSSTIAQVEIFGPVLVTMTFRTPEESVALANNTPYGLAASVWTESINLALDIAPKIKAGVVWMNSTNLFDAAAGFGGYRESGFGREGGREGMWEYVKREAANGGRGDGGNARNAARTRREQRAVPASRIPRPRFPPIDRTPKLFIGGKQARPDQGVLRDAFYSPSGRVGRRVARRKPQGHSQRRRSGARGGRRVGARHGTQSRPDSLLHRRESVGAAGGVRAAHRRDDGVRRRSVREQEVEASISRLFTYGAWADKYDGAVHSVPIRGVVDRDERADRRDRASRVRTSSRCSA